MTLTDGITAFSEVLDKFGQFIHTELVPFFSSDMFPLLGFILVCALIGIAVRKFKQISGIKLPILIIFLTLFIMPVMAMNITFSDVGLTSQTILIYYPNGTLLTTATSAESVWLNETANDYIFVFKPSASNVLKDPWSFLELGWSYAKYIIVFAMMLFGLKLLLGGRLRLPRIR